MKKVKGSHCPTPQFCNLSISVSSFSKKVLASLLMSIEGLCTLAKFDAALKLTSSSDRFPFSCRYQRFEKAFLLAVDIGARDLFMVSRRQRLLEDVICQLLHTLKQFQVICSLGHILKTELFYLCHHETHQ